MELKEEIKLIEFCVGGKLFQTFKSTIPKDSMLFSMISEKNETIKTKNGAYFIDRNPFYFEIILDFLRGYPLKELPNSQDREILKQEFEYYGILFPQTKDLLMDFKVFPSSNYFYNIKSFDIHSKNKLDGILTESDDESWIKIIFSKDVIIFGFEIAPYCHPCWSKEELNGAIFQTNVSGNWKELLSLEIKNDKIVRFEFDNQVIGKEFRFFKKKGSLGISFLNFF